MPIALRRVLVSVVCVATPALLAARSQPPVAPPHIPICTGLTLVTAVNDGGGDYESIKRLESVDDKQMTLHYSTQRMDYGGLFDSHPPKLRSYEFRRVLDRDAIRTSRAYLQEFSELIPELVPGMTSLGTSTVVLTELKTKGEAEFGISHWAFPVAMNTDPNDGNSIQKKQMRVTSKVVDRGTLTVLVNGQPTQLPFIHTNGNFYSYISEFWFLDQPDNPITLKFRIGIGEIKPLDQSTKDNCKEWLKNAGYLPPHCLKPDGGDHSVLELVKINYRCDDASTTLPPGSGSGSGAGTGLGAGAGAGNASGAGAAAGAGSGSGAGEIESALAKDNRVEIFDIFFSFDSDEIRKESEPRLTDIATVLKRHPDWKLKVEGHTDSLAADDYNLKLSQRRAAAVKNALVSRYKIDAARLVPEGFGETKPRASNDTLAGRARNRRVELVRVP
jgi:outer membrane protein OmpA-like peptidoglycan-associated protein